MQETRQQILEVLNQHGRATVQEIVNALQEKRGNEITAVTVRHHLNLLQKQNLVANSEMRRQGKPGRPQHVYTLTEDAHDFFPSDYQNLTSKLIKQLHAHATPSQVNVIFEGIADTMAAEAHIPEDDITTTERLQMVVEYLNKHGYDASWEAVEDGYILHTMNCPYHDIARQDDTLCQMDMRLITSMMGSVPRRLSLVSCGEQSCSYFFPSKT